MHSIGPLDWKKTWRRRLAPIEIASAGAGVRLEPAQAILVGLLALEMRSSR